VQDQGGPNRPAITTGVYIRIAASTAVATARRIGRLHRPVAVPRSHEQGPQNIAARLFLGIANLADPKWSLGRKLISNRDNY
jgi:superfamily II DNA or RNA helicase